MVLHAQREPLRLSDVPEPEPGPGQVLLRIHVCGVCRTDLHIVDGDLTEPKLPLVPGHQIVATVEATGEGAERFDVGQRVGVPWLGWTDGTCRYCRTGRENLCVNARFTGYDIDGGYAEAAVADERFCFPIPEGLSRSAGRAAAVRWADRVSVAPPLRRARRAGRALRLRGLRPHHLPGGGSPGARGLRAHASRGRGRPAVRPGGRGDVGGDTEGGSEVCEPGEGGLPEPLDAAIIFAPVGDLVPAALRAVAPGGAVVSAGIHMSDIPSFPYEILWGERIVRSVANLTRQDGEEFLRIAPEVPVRTKVAEYPLERANEALDDLRAGRFEGAAVLTVQR